MVGVKNEYFVCGERICVGRAVWGSLNREADIVTIKPPQEKALVGCGAQIKDCGQAKEKEKGVTDLPRRTRKAGVGPMVLVTPEKQAGLECTRRCGDWFWEGYARFSLSTVKSSSLWPPPAHSLLGCRNSF